VATTSVERLLDYCLNSPEDGLYSASSVKAVNDLITANREENPAD
jgi:4-O-beta-D-mannosyl-D-glucose phosphorylase